MTGAPFHAAMRGVEPPPIMAALRHAHAARLPEGLDLINLSQAAPALPPPEPLRAAMADAIMTDPAAHLYGPILGLPELREAVAERSAEIYQGVVGLENVAITAGCNQAFCAAIATLAGPGDEVIVPTPWYFNHAMWLEMSGITVRPLSVGPDLLPDPEQASALVTPRSRAIVLVTPNNPCGTEYPPELMRAFAALARRHGLALIVDETYRDFHAGEGSPHDLFTDPEWQDTLIQLYSFSKAYRLTGHRVGAVVAGAARIAEIEKFLDTVTICPAQPGQIGALWGMRNLRDWLGRERQDVLARRAAMARGIDALDGWGLKGCGAYFAYVTSPFDLPSDAIAPLLVERAGLLLLPGTIFVPEGDPQGPPHLRIAFANLDLAGIDRFLDRLRALPRQLGDA